MSFSKVLFPVTTQTILNRQEKLAEAKNKELFFALFGFVYFCGFWGEWGFFGWLVGFFC